MPIVRPLFQCWYRWLGLNNNNSLSLSLSLSFSLSLSLSLSVPTGSPSRGGDVVVYIYDIDQPSLPTLFYSVLVSISVFLALSTAFRSINSPDNSPLFSLYSCGLISALLVISTKYLSKKVSFSPDMILRG